MELKASFKLSTREITLKLKCEGCFFYPRYVENTVYKELRNCKNFKKCMRKALIDSGNNVPLSALHIRRA